MSNFVYNYSDEGVHFWCEFVDGTQWSIASFSTESYDIKLENFMKLVKDRIPEIIAKSLIQIQDSENMGEWTVEEVVVSQEGEAEVNIYFEGDVYGIWVSRVSVDKNIRVLEVKRSQT